MFAKFSPPTYRQPDTLYLPNVFQQGRRVRIAVVVPPLHTYGFLSPTAACSCRSTSSSRRSSSP